MSPWLHKQAKACICRAVALPGGVEEYITACHNRIWRGCNQFPNNHTSHHKHDDSWRELVAFLWKVVTPVSTGNLYVATSIFHLPTSSAIYKDDHSVSVSRRSEVIIFFFFLELCTRRGYCFLVSKCHQTKWAFTHLVHLRLTSRSNYLVHFCDT